MSDKDQQKTFYRILKAHKHVFSPDEVASYFKEVNNDRVEKLSSCVSDYIESNLPKMFSNRKTF